MRPFIISLGFLALTALPACAQTSTDPLLEGRELLAGTGEAFLVPEEARLQPVALLGSGRLELKLDSGLGLASIRSETMPDKPGMLTPSCQQPRKRWNGFGTRRRWPIARAISPSRCISTTARHFCT